MRPSRRALRSLVACVAVLAALLAAPACRRAARPSAAVTASYHCPMHPTYVSGQPGDCPICGMKLVAMGGEAPATAVVEGRAPLVLSAERRQLSGVTSIELRPQALVQEIRAVGFVTADERRLHHVHAKFEAYVEQLYVDFTGKFVQRGEPLLSLYAPDLVATQEEYLLAYRAQEQLASSGIASVRQGGLQLLEAARQRLLFWDIRPADVETLQRTGRVKRTLDLHAELSGFVVQKNVVHGMRVTPADTLFDVADLSHVWVLADVYESDLPALRVGQQAEVSVTYLPGRSWRGPLTNVAPTVDEATRTIKVRVEVENEGARLKPGMFADVRLLGVLGHGLVLPDDAVVRGGRRDVVFVERGEGRYEPRAVRLGERVRGGLRVLDGLATGERVASGANFLLDSESSLRAALAATTDGAPQAPHRH